jgi:hypothetical protein
VRDFLIIRRNNMSTRHEIDGATPGRTVYDAAEVYDLTPLEVARMHAMDKSDQELADYKGFPMVQAQILLDRRDVGCNEVTYSNVTGMGVTAEEMAPPNDESTKRTLRTGAEVVRLTRSVGTIDQAAVA